MKKVRNRMMIIFGTLLMTCMIYGGTVFAADHSFTSPGDGDYALLNKPVEIKFVTSYRSSNNQAYCRIKIEKPNGESETLEHYRYTGSGYEAEASFTPEAEGTYKITAELGGYLTIGGIINTILDFDPDITETISVKAVKTIPKTANPLKVKAKTATVKYSKLKKKSQSLAVGKVMTFTKKGKGKITYAKASGNKKITINKNTGKVTVKKNLKKGTYKVKVKVKAAGDSEYNAITKTVTFKVKIK